MTEKAEIYCDPNAFINCKKEKTAGVKQIVFAEPYDCLPTYHIDYGFKKGNCSCVPKPQKNNCKNAHNCNESKSECGNLGIFNIFSSLFPQILNNGGGVNNILSLLNSSVQGKDILGNLQGGTNNIFSTLLSNGNLMSNITKMFSPNKNQQTKNCDIVTTEYEIKNYTKV